MDFGKDVLKNSSFDCELHFLRMMLLLLNDLNKIHASNILHRDIKCENIMFYEKNGNLFFCFIDFGSSINLSEKHQIIDLVQTYTPFYSAPEQNTPEESFASKKKIKKI